MVGVIRIELMASSMSTKRSTTELHALINCYNIKLYFFCNLYCLINFFIRKTNKKKEIIGILNTKQKILNILLIFIWFLRDKKEDLISYKILIFFHNLSFFENF